MFAPPPAPEPLPAELEQAINSAVQRFESRWASFNMLPFARSIGLVDEYRAELESLARKAWEAGKCAAQN